MSAQDRLELYLQYRAELINYASALLSARERAEDLVQEAWLRFQYHPLEGVQQPVAYLFRMIRNMAMDELRSQVREQQLNTPLSEAEELHSDDSDPALAASRTIALERLQSALEDLDEDCRLAFELHRFSGLTLKQIANRLGVSQSSAHRSVQSAMQHCLRAINGPYYD